MSNQPLVDIPALQKDMARENLEAIVVLSQANMWVFSGYPLSFSGLQIRGYGRNAAVVVPQSGEPTLVVGAFEEEIARARGSLKNRIVTFPDYVVPTVKRVADVLDADGLSKGRVGIEARHMTRNNDVILRETLPDTSFVSCDDLLDQVRSLKTESDVQATSEASQVVREAIRAGLASARSGDSEWSLHVRVQTAIQRSLWTERIDGSIVSGERMGLFGAQPSNRLLQAGDLVRARYLCSVNGQPGTATLMASVGAPSPRVAALCESYRHASDGLLAQIRAGMTGQEVYESALSVFASEGLVLLGNSVGHGLGAATVERPYLSLGEAMTIGGRMLLTIEPETSDGIAMSHLVEIVDGVARSPLGIRDDLLIIA